MATARLNNLALHGNDSLLVIPPYQSAILEPKPRRTESDEIDRRRLDQGQGVEPQALTEYFAAKAAARPCMAHWLLTATLRNFRRD